MKKGFYKGCGCSLLAIGVIAVLFAIILAVGSWAADENAGKKNDAEWDEYNAWVAQVDSMEDRVLADSLMETRQAPIIRQGGFATAFGAIFAIAIIAVATIPIVAGIIMMSIYRQRKKQELMQKQLNDKSQPPLQP